MRTFLCYNFFMDVLVVLSAVVGIIAGIVEIVVNFDAIGVAIPIFTPLPF